MLKSSQRAIEKSFIFLTLWTLFLFVSSFHAEAAPEPSAFDYRQEVKEPSLEVAHLDPVAELAPLLEADYQQLAKATRFQVDALPGQLSRIEEAATAGVYSPDRIRRQISAAKKAQ